MKESTQHHRRIAELEGELLKALRRIAELEATAAQLAKAAHEDPLTEVLNRRGFADRLEAIGGVVKRHSAKFTNPHPYFVAIDLDHFKKVNDVYGHAAGDAVLRQFAQILVDGVRDYDLVARWGGEEFMIALVDITTQEAKQKADQIADVIRQTQFSAGGDEQIKVTASFGLADDLEKADKALYQAKSAGRNRVVSA